MPEPRVSVRNSVRKPISPRVGTRNSRRTQPVPWLTMFSMRPLRSASICVTTPRKSSGMSIARRSIGSCSAPSTSRVTTWGLPTVSSNPSRRIVSTSTASCSSPRPCTSQVSGRSVSNTRMATLPTSSWLSRSSTIRAVSFDPDCPASGELLIPTVMPSAGSSTAITGSGRGSAGSAIVSPIVISAMPGQRDDLARPGLLGRHPPQARRSRTAPRPSRSRRCRRAGTRPLPALCGSRPGARGRARRGPRSCRRRGSSRAPAAGGPGSYSGAGMRSTSRSSSGRRSVPSTPSSAAAQPALRVRVDDRELDLRLVGVEVEEQLVDLVHHLAAARVGAVHLVHAPGPPAAGPRAPCAARSGSAAAGPPRRPPAASPRRPSSGRARPRRRSRRGRACPPG